MSHLDDRIGPVCIHWSFPICSIFIRYVCIILVMVQLMVYIPIIFGIIILNLLVLLKNRNNRTNILFLALGTSTALFIVSLFVADISHQETTALFFARLAIVFSSFIAYFFLLFSPNFPVYRGIKRLHPWLLILPAVLFSILAFSSLMIKDITLQSWGAELTSTGILYLIQGIYILIYFVIGIILLLNRKRHSSSIEKTQMNFVLFGATFALIVNLLANSIFPALGISNLVILGNISFIIFIGSITYAIIRHKLFDIRAVVARSFAFVISIALLATIYGLVAFQVVSRLLSTNISQLAQQVIYTILAVVLAFTFQPIRRFFEKVSNKVFYRDHYDAQGLVNEAGRILSSEIDLDKMSTRLIAELQKQMKIGKIQMVIFGQKELYYENNVFNKDGQRIPEKDLKKLGRVMVVADDLQSGERKRLLQEYGISVSLALRTSEKFIGYMLLGEKKSGDIYSQEDIRVLKIVANEVSVASANALSYKEIQQFSDTLAEKVRVRTAQLRHANEQLKELDRAKDEFISMASHQLRTPLTTLKGYISMLDEGDFGKLSKEQKQYVGLAFDGSNRMARLIDDLLNISRMGAGKFYIDARQIDLNEIVPQELQQLSSMAKSKNVDLRYIKPKKPVPMMNLDETKTRQVIMNLADNAVHYSAPPKGGGKVEVRLERDGDDVVYVVRDNGIGVPRDQQSKLFSKMFRAKNAQEVRPDGTGLGLFLVKRVVEDQGGKLIFESTPGKGSVFGFRMPIHNKIVVDKKAQKALAEAHKNT